MDPNIVSIQYKTKETKSVKNAQIAASAFEDVITGTTLFDHFNTLIVQNLDINSDVEVRLDAYTDKRFFAQKGGGIVNIKPEDNLNFRSVKIVNLNSGAVVAANAVLVNAAFKEVV